MRCQVAFFSLGVRPVSEWTGLPRRLRSFFSYEESPVEQSTIYRKRYWILVFAVLGLGVLLLAPTYTTRMWNAGHYQYFPLVFVAVIGLLWANRAEVIEAAEPCIGWVVGALLIAITLQLVFANILYSGFMGVLALVLAVWTGYYAAFGWGGLKIAAPVLSLLVFVIPLPMQWDEQLIVTMQLIASDYASRFLDGVGVIHFRQGVILQTGRTQFLTEEACSGIRSLFSSWAVVAIYGVATGHRWWRILVNLFQTVLWVMVGNVLRIVAVVALADRVPWLASGMGHELLGLGVFAFILLMVALTDYAISGLIRTELVFETNTDTSIFGELFDPAPAKAPAFQVPPFPVVGGLRKSLLIGLLLLLVVSLRSAWVRPSSLSRIGYANNGDVPVALESVLPESLAGMRRVSFRHDFRGPNYLWAQSSYVWEFSDDRLRAVVSLDSPWDDWHNLDVCYTNIGWKTEPQFGIEPADEAMREAMPGYRQSELVMRRASKSGFVVYSAIDRLGRPVLEPRSSDPFSALSLPGIVLSRLWAGLGFGPERLNLITPDRLPIETVQLYAESTRPLTEADQEKLRALFFEARRELVAWKGGEGK